MLVLSRYVGEDLVANFGGEVLTIRILEVKGRKVRIGLSAPEAIQVDRLEIAEQKAAWERRRQSKDQKHGRATDDAGFPGGNGLERALDFVWRR